MKKITKDNINDFIHYYHAFHDSYITNIKYDITKSTIEIFLNLYWSGEPTLNNDKTYETNKTKMKIIFIGVEKFNTKEIFSWDYIYEAFIKYITIKNKEYICFATDEDDPQIYIVCEKIQYEEMK